MKIIILSGFLGSGKTTVLLSLVNYLVNKYQSESSPIPVAVIENEIGDISIDDQIIAAKGYHVKSLFSGCICCTLVADLAICVNDIAATAKPAYIIIEATGLAYPDKIADTIKKYADGCEDLKILTITDAERWDETFDMMENMLTQQIRSADIVLLNKIDTVNKKEIVRLHDILQCINNKAEIAAICAKEGLETEFWSNILAMEQEND